MAVESLQVPLGSLLPWFEVKPLSGGVLNTSNLVPDHPVLVAFLSKHSPYVQPIEESLASTTKRFEREISALAICSNDPRAYPADSENALKEQARRAHFRFPYCVDEGQRAAKAFGANCTPEFFVYDRRFRLAYHGQFDSSRPDNDIPVTGEDLVTAIEHVIRSEVLHEDQIPSFGCSIKWTAGNEPLYLYTIGA